MAAGLRAGHLFRRSFLLCRPYSGGSSPIQDAAAPRRSRLVDDTALSGKTRREVFRGWLVFKLLSSNWIVEKSVQVRSR